MKQAWIPLLLAVGCASTGRTGPELAPASELAFLHEGASKRAPNGLVSLTEPEAIAVVERGGAWSRGGDADATGGWDGSADLPLLAQSEEAPHGFWEHQHPMSLAFLSAAPVKLQYSTSGTGNDRAVDLDSRWFRFYAANWGGLEIDWMESNVDKSTGGRLRSFESFLFANYPLRPADFARVYIRPGLYFSEVKISGAVPGDVEPWVLGAKGEVEGELDLFKGESVIISTFLSGRFGWGWGRADTFTGSESVSSPTWGYEVGLRVQGGYVYFAASFIERRTEVRGDNRFSEADYDIRGGALSIGGRW